MRSKKILKKHPKQKIKLWYFVQKFESTVEESPNPNGISICFCKDVSLKMKKILPFESPAVAAKADFATSRISLGEKAVGRVRTLHFLPSIILNLLPWSHMIYIYFHLIVSYLILSNFGCLMSWNNFTFWAGLHGMSFLPHTAWQRINR